MSLGCAPGCGDCCDPVVLPYAQWLDLTQRARQADVIECQNTRWIAQHLHPAGMFTDAGGVDRIELACDAFDPASRLCAAFEDRPPMCSGYPWYGDDPQVPGRALELYRRCSYLLDVPPAQRPEDARPLIPLTVVRRAQ